MATDAPFNDLAHERLRSALGTPSLIAGGKYAAWTLPAGAPDRPQTHFWVMLDPGAASCLAWFANADGSDERAFVLESDRDLLGLLAELTAR
jgi:hypothetical protein